jgi:hypothetical protein
MAAFEPVSLSELAENARRRGVPAAYRVCVSETMDVPPVFVDFEVDGAMGVRMLTPGYEPVIEHDDITDFRAVPLDPVSDVQQGFVGLHVLFTSLRQGGFTIDEAAAVVAAMVRGGAASQEET